MPLDVCVRICTYTCACTLVHVNMSIFTYIMSMYVCAYLPLVDGRDAGVRGSPLNIPLPLPWTFPSPPYPPNPVIPVNPANPVNLDPCPGPAWGPVLSVYGTLEYVAITFNC